jgi:hypothetical protein
MILFDYLLFTFGHLQLNREFSPLPLNVVVPVRDNLIHTNHDLLQKAIEKHAASQLLLPLFSDVRDHVVVRCYVVIEIGRSEAIHLLKFILCFAEIIIAIPKVMHE